jgi:BirA family biotin operon repressor/biotin-[acetyl-CoA-carboxylase] ligase
VKKSIDRTAEAILSLLKQGRKSFQAPGKLAYRLQINLNTLDSALAELKSWGYKIRVSKGKGIRLEGVPDLLTSLEIKEGLKTKTLGKEIHAYHSLGSTNEVAFRLAEAGAAEGTMVVAEKQTAGRGRLSRKWHSPPGLGIWLSLILRPQIPLAWVPALSLCATLACIQTTEKLTGKIALLKWPNDAFLNGKKFSGVLTELSAEADRMNFVVLGIGINLNHTARDFPRLLRSKATSLRMESKKKIPRVFFLQNFLENFEDIYLNYKKEGLEKFKPEIMKKFYLLNKEATVQVGEKKLTGKAVDIDPCGALILETKSGLKTITAGDVTLV